MRPVYRALRRDRLTIPKRDSLQVDHGPVNEGAPARADAPRYVRVRIWR